jgi:ankyrin repeat protein
MVLPRIVPRLHKAINEYLSAPIEDHLTIVEQIVTVDRLAKNYTYINEIYRGYTPLGKAAKANDIVLLKLLVDNGADVDCPGHRNDSIKTMLSAHYHNHSTYSLNDLVVQMHFMKLFIPCVITVKCHEFGQNNLQAYKSLIKERGRIEFLSVKEMFSKGGDVGETDSLEIAGLVLEYLHINE